MKKTAINNLKVDENLLDFIDNEVIPGTGIDPKKFWSEFDKSIHELSPKNKELIHNDKKSVITVLFLITTFSYFYPVIKHAKNKLDCEAIAKNYIIKNKNIIGINNREIKMI